MCLYSDIMQTPSDHKQTWDAMEEYFECIVECDIYDKECTDKCLVELKDEEA